MEDKKLLERFNGALAEAVSILEIVRQGFLAQKLDVIRKGRRSFREFLLSRVAFAQEVIDIKNKTEGQRYYLALLPSFQTIALGIENLVGKMEAKVEADIPFSEKGLAEVTELFTVMEEQLGNTKDYIITKNSVLRASIDEAWQKIFRLSNEYGRVHQDRLFTGACMPQASYLYLDMVDSIKRISRELHDFSERV